ncbi:MAG: cyclopropane-fatty-acyl-phospholipid synthase family protein [Cyanobacteria bacterium P01_H01_bin.74]
MPTQADIDFLDPKTTSKTTSRTVDCQGVEKRTDHSVLYDHPKQIKPALQSMDWISRQCCLIFLNALKSMSQGQLLLSLPLPHTQTLRFGINTSQDNATEPAATPHIIVHSDEFFRQVILFGHIGFSEAYMQGMWDTPDIAAVIRWFIVNVSQSTVLEGSGSKDWKINLLGSFNRFVHLLKDNNKQNSVTNIQNHYDLGNPFFQLFLDAETMTYSSGLFQSAETTLSEAQYAKYEALCQKLRLTKTDRVLEIGSGWGGFAVYAAKTYGCHVHTITLSQEQYAFATEKIKSEGLSSQIAIEIRDYRDLNGQYDKIVSIEMVEAVGEAYMDTFFGQCTRLLKPDGLFAIQMITCPDSRYAILKNNVDFIQKHIFPGSLLPSLARVTQALTKAGNLSLFELQDMGLDYSKTLALWEENFTRGKADILALGFDHLFIRKWHYYFQYCIAAFSSRNISVVQAVYTAPNNPTLML